MVLFTQEVFMNIDQISPSILHVTAKENLNIEHDLTLQSDKTISQLIIDETKKEENQKDNPETAS